MLSLPTWEDGFIEIEQGGENELPENHPTGELELRMMNDSFPILPTLGVIFAIFFRFHLRFFVPNSLSFCRRKICQFRKCFFDF